FGAGRTFPVSEGGKRVLRIGAVIDILEGFGKFKDLPGTVCVNGYIEPPNKLALNLMVRFMDLDARLLSSSALSSIQTISNPDPDAVFMTFLGETDPNRPVKLQVTPDGQVLGSKVFERLRLVHTGFDLKGLRSTTYEGPIVGRLSANLH